MQYSHSKVECHIGCPYKYKLRYKDKLKTIPDYEANNALICGNTMHQGAETNLNDALEFYYSNYPIINNKHVEEVIKFEYLIPKIHEILSGINVYKKEFRINTSRFVGIVDLITKNEDGSVDVFDYKYSNNHEKYADSPQLHLYKYFLEKIGFKVNKLGFIFIPKVSIKQKQDESTYEFRKRLNEELKNSKIKIMEVKYDAEKVVEFMNSIINITEDTEFKKVVTGYCDWCEYKNLCLKGEDIDMQLPSSERRDIKKTNKRKIWIYGPAFSGKTTMLDDAPTPLNLNTDGNIEFVTMPYVSLKDQVTVTGRITNRKLAWEVFKDTISELEKKQNDFKTIIVDLLEDTREMCRIYKYDELKIQHESDSGFGKGWDIIKTEYLSTIRRLFNLDYENIIVLSHEDVSKDITKKNGQNITRIAPNIQDAIANKIAGMVDIVARVVVNGDERTLNFKSDEVVFGGGRLKGISKTSIPLSWDELMKVYDEANQGRAENKSVGKEEIAKVEDKPRRRSKKEETKVEDNNQDKDTVEESKTEVVEEIKEETLNVEAEKVLEEPLTGEVVSTTPVEEEKPRRRRSRKTE